MWNFRAYQKSVPAGPGRGRRAGPGPVQDLVQYLIHDLVRGLVQDLAQDLAQDLVQVLVQDLVQDQVQDQVQFFGKIMELGLNGSIWFNMGSY